MADDNLPKEIEEYSKGFSILSKKEQGRQVLLMLKTFRMATRTSIYVVLLTVVILGSLLIYFHISHKQQMGQQLRDLTKIKKHFRLQDMGIQERKENFRNMMIRILDVYGHTYRKNDVKAMTFKQRLKYINLCYNAAEDLDFGYFDVPSFHLKESSFNPNQDGIYKELGMGQQMWSTALMGVGYLKTMPPYLRKKYHFDLQKKEDLYDPIVSTKVTFVVLWGIRNEMKGNTMWTVSMYKWGRFLWKHFRNGRGYIPAKFTISGIDYDPAGYYTRWQSLRESFERGDIEPGVEMVAKWKREEERLVREEFDYRRMSGLIKGLMKKVEKLTAAKEEVADINEELKKELVASAKAMRDIARVVKTGKVDVIKELRKTRKVAYDFLMKIEKEDKIEFYIWCVAAVIVLLCCLFIFYLGIRDVWKFTKNLFKKIFNKKKS